MTILQVKCKIVQRYYSKIIGNFGGKMITRNFLLTVLWSLLLLNTAHAKLFELMHMEDTEISLPIEAVENKATVVIFFDMNKPSLYMHFIGDRLLGETSGPTYFVSEIDPGEQWYYMVPRIKDKAVDLVRASKITFEAGKVYYFMVKFITGKITILAPQSPQEFNKEVTDSKLRALKFVEGKSKIAEVKEKWLEKAREEFEEDVADKKSSVQDIINYRGY